MEFYSDGLTETQMQVLHEVAPFASQRRFYMGGGTALAIFLRHRRSIDLDWFTQERLPDPMALAQSLRDAGIPFSTGQTAPGTLHGQVKGVRLSFLEFRYSLIAPLVDWEETGALLASLNLSKLEPVTGNPVIVLRDPQRRIISGAHIVDGWAEEHGYTVYPDSSGTINRFFIN